jgi:hypothetical protein
VTKFLFSGFRRQSETWQPLSRFPLIRLFCFCLRTLGYGP